MSKDYTQERLYTLQWPAALFVKEMEFLLSEEYSVIRDTIPRLCEEAFQYDEPSRELKRRINNEKTPFTGFFEKSFFSSGDGTPEVVFGKELLVAGKTNQFHLASAPTPFSRSQTGTVPQSKTSFARAYMDVFEDLLKKGYFVSSFGEKCVDTYDDPHAEINKYLFKCTGVSGLFPLKVTDFEEDEGLLYTVVEALFDMVARPRINEYHSYSQCGWHYKDFSTATGQALYAHLVNEALKSSGIPLNMSDSGYWAGRLSQATSSAVMKVSQEVVNARRKDEDQDELRNAIDIFLNREQTLENRRLAVLAVGRALEVRRENIDEYDKKLGSTLFAILNKYEIRHHGKNQVEAASPEVLAWIFHTMLATIELVDKL